MILNYDLEVNLQSRNAKTVAEQTSCKLHISNDF